MYVENDNIKLAFDFVQNTGRNIFLTGKAGTGKTTFLKNIKDKINKRTIIVAPTGVAAINAGGVTIHSFFQMPFGPILPENIAENDADVSLNYVATRDITRQRFSKVKIDIMRSLDLLIIDEISMVRADLLDGIDIILRRIRRNTAPFGGVQLLMIGDIHQLAPVVKDDEWDILKQFYTTCFFFSSRALMKTQYLSIELNEIFRQSDINFINLLNNVRDNNVDKITLDELNKRYNPGILSSDNEGYITLTTHNYQAQRINDSKLDKIKSPPVSFEALISGDFPEYSYPTLASLVLKKNAQVMFVKNDSSAEKQYYNGKIGKVVDFDEDRIVVSCKDDKELIYVVPEKWDNIKYEIDQETKEIKEITAGSFVQYPLKLAWAITIHKSQGLTFDKAIIDASSAFAFGQVYVALSRCRSLEGLVLSSPVNSRCIIRDATVAEFSEYIARNHPGETQLTCEKFAYKKQLIAELSDFEDIKKIIYQIKISVELYKSSFAVSTSSTYMEFYTFFNAGVLDVADKFRDQIINFYDLGVIKNVTNIESRLNNACNYFIDKINYVNKNYLSKVDFDCDNKEIKKSVNETFSNLCALLYIKIKCFEACVSGFETIKYLEAKNKAIIQAVSLKRISSPEKAKKSTKSVTENPVLYKRLKKWREQKAEEEGISVSRILRQQQLEEIAALMPVSFQQLSANNLLSKNKINKYGIEIISIVMNYSNVSSDV